MLIIKTISQKSINIYSLLLTLKSHPRRDYFLTALFVIPISLLLILNSFFLIPVSAQESSDSADSVRENVRKQIENLNKKPKAVAGTLDMISDTTLKINTEAGKIVLVATGENSTYLRTTNDKKTEIKFADLAISDYIVAMGYKNGNDILDAQRILVYDEKPFPKKHTMFATVEDNKNKVLTVKLPGSKQTWSVQIQAKTEISSQTSTIKGENVLKGDRAVVVGTLSEKEDRLVLSTKIYVLRKTEDTSPPPSPKVSPKPSPIP